MTPPGDWPTGATRFAGVIGDPVRHSLSPALHNAAYAALGLDWAYGAFPVAPWQVDGAVTGAASLGFVGLSVTMPHKEAVLRVADETTPTVERLGSANTLRFDRGRVAATSTDGEGLVADLRAASFDPAGAEVVVIGAGGAARAVVVALAESGAKRITVVNRTEDRARAAVALAGPAGRLGGPASVEAADLVVKATPVGMPVAAPAGEPEGASHEGAALGGRCQPGQLVVDLVYHPARTPFLDAAAAAGATVRNGLGMLVHQAALQVAWWTGEDPPLDVMWSAVSAHAGDGAG